MRISVSLCVCMHAHTHTEKYRKVRKCYHIQTIICSIHTCQKMAHTEGSEIKAITLDSDSLDGWRHYTLLSSLLLRHACVCFKQ